MKLLGTLCLFVLIAGLAMAQTNSSTTSDPSSLAEEVRQLRQLMTDQQKAMADQQATVAEQQKQLAEQQRELESLRRQVVVQPQAAAGDPGQASPRLLNAALITSSSSTAVPEPVSSRSPQEPKPKESPLSFRIGGAEFTPGGFMDFTSIFRTTNTGNPGGTNFFAIPFNNTIAAHLTENRFTAQNSRIALKVTSQFGKNDVTGYVEADFLGNDAANVFVTSNSHTFRQRLYFVDLKRDKFELLAGQAWSWLTPNRKGLSPIPADIFYSLDMDFNYQVGLTWTRAPQVRFAYHPTENWALGVALENPEQFGGQGEITYPAFFNAQLGGQIDQANISSTPNLHPDIIPKIAYDTDVNGKHYHAELAGLVTSYKVTNLGPPLFNFVKHTKTGAGIEAAVNLELIKNFHLVSNLFYSDGGGRYIFGMGPGTVVLPTADGTDVRLSLVHSGSGITGFEYQAFPNTMFYAYYGGAYFQRNYAPDTTTGARPGALVGFGYPNGANNQNKSIQEPTLGWIQTFWKSPQYGALQLITQASYLTRAPWFVPAGAPKNAHLFMSWADLRYVLP